MNVILEKFLDIMSAEGHKKEVTLKRALDEIQAERIRRGHPIYNFTNGIKLSTDEELEDMENQVRTKLFG